MDIVTSVEKPAKEALNTVKGVLSSLLLGVKMFSLYAEDHAQCSSAVERLHEGIENFHRAHGDLGLEVKKNRLLFGGEAVYKGDAKEGDIAFALFRDGVLDFVFEKGLELEETKTFLRIIHRYKALPVEAEGDIVTGLWEAQLPHIQYRAAENILDTGPGSDQSGAKNKGPGGMQSALRKNKNSSMSMEMQMITEGILETGQGVKELPKIDVSSLRLTAEEAKKLEEMVRYEEDRDATHEILDMMADILRRQQDQAFFAVILEYLEEELSDAFGRRDFELSFGILKRLHQIRRRCKDYRPWALSLVDSLLRNASTPDFLASLEGTLDSLDKSDMKLAVKALVLLSPEAIGPIAALLPNAPSSQVRTLLSKAIIGLGVRDFNPIEKLTEEGDEDILHHLMPLLGYMKDEQSARVLPRMVKHPSERVRRISLKTIIFRKLWIPEKLMSLLDDQSNPIRQLFLKYLGTRKSESTERQLVSYLRNRKFRRHDRDHLIACFRALGRCSKGRSVPYLSQILLGGRWITKFRESPLRFGAAVALANLDTEEAKKVLGEGSRSRYPGIRKATRSVAGEKDAKGDNR